MASIPHTVLVDDLTTVLGRVEAGERFSITVAGRPVAELAPVGERHHVSAAAARAALTGLARPRGVLDDCRDMSGRLVDPFA